MSLTDDLVTQGRECESDLAAQDSHFLDTIEGGFLMEVEGDRLTVSRSDGPGLTFVGEP